MKHTHNELPDYIEEICEPDDPPGSNGASKGNGHAKQDTDVGEGSWPVMPVAAYHGLAGEVVAIIAPHTEADPVALHLHYLTSFGSAVGRGPYYQVEATPHFGNLFLVTVGRTSRARKGTGADWIHRIFEIVESDWARDVSHSA